MSVQLEKKKICMIGSFGVGKTSLVERYVYNRFDDKYLSTLGVKVSQKILPPVHHPHTGLPRQFMFLLWDIASIDKFETITTNYYRGAAGALAVADLTRPETTNNLNDYCEKFLTLNPKGKLIILGNKNDLVPNNGLARKIIEEIASTFSAAFLLSSAKSGENVEESFLLLAKKLEV
jgi:small GTP-binding protein